MKKTIYSLEQLAIAAGLAAGQQTDNRILGFDGQQGIYVGQGDDLLDIGGDVQNFGQEGDIGRQFGIVLTNASESTALTARLFAGYLTGNSTLKPGQIADGAFAAVSGAAGLSAASSTPGVSVAEIVQFMKEFPTRVIAMQFEATKSTQLKQAMAIGGLSIYGTPKIEYVRPGVGRTERNLNDKIVTMPTNFQIGKLSDITYTVLPATEVTLIFYTGATVNTEAYLQRRAQKGKAGAAAVGQAVLVNQASTKALGSSY